MSSSSTATTPPSTPPAPLLTAALTNLDSSIQETITSLYALQTAFINACNASQQPSVLSWHELPRVQPGSNPFDNIRASFRDLLIEVSATLRKAHTWMGNPIILCQLNRQPLRRSELAGIRQVLLETYHQVIPIREASDAIFRRCEAFILQEFEQVVQHPDTLDLLSRFRTDTSKLHLKVHLDTDSEAFVRANLAVLYPDGISALAAMRSSLAEMHRALFGIYKAWITISEICRLLVQTQTHCVSDSYADGLENLLSNSSRIDPAEIEDLSQSMYDEIIWKRHRKELSSSIWSLNKMASLLLVVPSGASTPLWPAPTLAMVPTFKSVVPKKTQVRQRYAWSQWGRVMNFRWTF
ncbi:hypothetical protein GYMLUDRAFT_58262 [Collybiopsis luxurians FD-317 M1]|uniref:Uncharacterized protein n=1 Tax=Collybiopsis luxurians FD-317 M1 TaxID=944289 RepID=A0A0D0CT27_9AGAR|nr:hypothetical protein GYMLUDRAFT_58262 [Collybiopsis luxurians FD-317 M1]